MKRVGTKKIVMKKIIIFSVMLAGSLGLVKAQTGSRCHYAATIRAIVEKTDSIGLFFRRLQNSQADQWTDFLKAAKSEKGLAAFEVCGNEKETLSKEFSQLHEGIGKELQHLIKQVDPDNQLPDEKFAAIVEEAFDCFIADKAAIDLKEVAGTAGREAPGDIGTQLGPCDNALRTCVSNARDVRMQTLNACGVTGTGFLIALKRLLSSWIGGGAALLCYISASVVYNGSIDVCLMDYVECLGRQH